MLSENDIAQKLRQNLPQPYTTDLAPVVAPTANDGQATIAPTYDLDEMTQYKLHDYFGQPYKETDEVNRQQVQFIYETVAKSLEDPQYGFVVAKIRDLERIIGIAHADNRLYRLYQWLKLDGVRRSIEAEQGALTNG